MNDMKQVAERLRMTEKDGKWVAYDAQAMRHQQHANDEHAAAMDWLAERDPAPLTVEAVTELGIYVGNQKIPPIFIYVGSFELRKDSGPTWEIFDSNVAISTVGELRTLARLAGVELKKGGE